MSFRNSAVKAGLFAAIATATIVKALALTTPSTTSLPRSTVPPTRPIERHHTDNDRDTHSQRANFIRCSGRTRPLYASSNDNNDDLFEYFDPLLSPHAYPNGIAPDKKPQELQTENSEAAAAAASTESTQSTKKKAFGIALPRTEEDSTEAKSFSDSSSSKKQGGDDLFDYFDPLLSPHAYPQGVSPSHKPTELQHDTDANDTPTTKTVGILLMDHGSKKGASNARLQSIAQLYQSSMDEQYNNDNNDDKGQVIVKAAHMEIATPSIPDGLQSLLDAGVDEIVCHPFFLSPDGRHVKEDIPEIIEGAIESLNIQVPVITTAPVGSNIELMLKAVHSLVVENSEVLEE